MLDEALLLVFPLGWGMGHWGYAGYIYTGFDSEMLLRVSTTYPQVEFPQGCEP